ncbi:hypothetical protein CE91St61_28300 [Lachnospiraceae bacterium]|nr:hypothetical protein CE91St61_28300 [Lachnospiraceae bacterium]
MAINAVSEWRNEAAIMEKLVTPPFIILWGTVRNAYAHVIRIFSNIIFTYLISSILQIRAI